MKRRNVWASVSVVAIAVTAAVTGVGAAPAVEASGQQFTWFDQNMTHGPTNQYAQATATAPADWTSPINYAKGRVYVRLEILSKPSTKLTAGQICVWRNSFAEETCSPTRSFSTTGVYWFDYGVPDTWWKKGGSWSWTTPFSPTRIMLKDAATGKLLLSQNCGAGCYTGTDLADHVPITMHAEAIVVAAGSTLAPPTDWTGCPAGWSAACPNPAVAPVFTDSAIARLVAGTRLVDAVAASGTPTPTYSVAAGALPAGLTLDPTTGAITGTPTAAGPYSFTIEAANTAGTVSTVISGVVEGAPDGSDEPTLGGFTVGVPFTGSVEIDGEPAPTYSVTDGELPDGLKLDPVTGAITGTPTTAGAYAFSITAVNVHGSVKMNFGGTIDEADDGPVDEPDDDGGPLLVRLDPARLVDTRTTERLDAGDVLRVPVAGIAGVPTDAESVALNVTVVDPADEGFVTVYPCGGMVPLASNVNFAQGEVVANAVTAAVGEDGAVCLYTLTDVDIVVDLNGGAYSTGEGTDGLMPLGPTRVLDTRNESTKPTAGSVQRIELRDLDGVPADATAAVLNVTVIEPEALGFITVYPCTDEVPTVSSVNYVAGQTVPNAVLAPFDADGAVCLFTLASAHIVVDVNGAFSPSEVDGTVRALAPTRLVDTRTSDTPLTANVPFELRVTGRGGVHADATGVIVNVTVTEPAAIGFVTVYRCGEPTPLASNLNFVAGETVANAVLAPVDAEGDICIVSLVDTNIVVDVNAARQK